MVLMALVIFGFMWFSRPSQEELKAQQEALEQAQKELTA